MNIIFLIHLIFLIGILVVPFTNNRRNLEFYSILINDDTCALTQAEMYFSGKEKEETFMGRVVGPIYKMSDDDVGKLTKTLFFVLWAIVQYRLGHFKGFTRDLSELKKSLSTKV